MTSYYGVIGNRDYIKLKGVRTPFWEFLDVQPEGWLSSLVYKRTDVPRDKPMIWDCGAWSYRLKDEPDYTPQECSDLYDQFAPDNSLVIAPDHMLIPGVDIAKRRAINLRNATEFLDAVRPRHRPMATIHGMTIDERVEAAAAYERLGYKYLALGGMAAQAGKKALATEIAEALRAAVPSVHLHVLGLSSPEYAARWKRIGINSFDGSSHFKQAFTGGLFYTREGARLVKHQAARPGNEDCGGIVAPECYCRACSTLRGEGIDTRTYGSNENNMGRAAHNMNILMQAQAEAMSEHVVLVACCGKKLSEPSRAKDLYRSELFLKSRRYAEQHGDHWLILSAKHGVVDPDTVIEPYDETLNEKSAAERRSWAAKVTQQLSSCRHDRLTVLAGEAYCGWVEGFNVERPMQGLGIGQQLQYLLQHTELQPSLF
jgi:hypothetical protein